MAKVKIQGHASGTGVLTITAPNTSSDRTITLPDATGTLATTADTFDPDGAVTINDTGAAVDFRVESDNNANMLFVDGSADKIGIGINNPGVQLANMSGTGTNIGAAGINWNSSEASKYVAQFRNGSDPAWGISVKLGIAAPEATDKYIDFIDDDGVIQSSLTGTGEAAGGLAIQTAGTERLKIASAGDVTVNSGDLIFGTAGKGVVLGATSNTDANTLDDYEEGTWTPALSVAPSGVTLGTVNVANYTKIGNRVFISLNCLITSSSSPAPNNDMRMTGFPFANADSNVNMPAIFNYNYMVTPQLHMNGSGYFYFQSTTVGGNNQSPAGGGLDASTSLSLAITYRTTA